MSLTLKFASLDEARKSVPRFVRRRLGSQLKATQAHPFRGEKELWQISVTYPVHLDASELGKPWTHFFRFDDLSSITIRKNLSGRETTFEATVPSRDELRKGLEKRFQTLVFRSEAGLLESVEERFVEISHVKNALNPIVEIISNLGQGAVSYASIVESRKSEHKAKAYVNLLTSLKFVQLEGKDIVPGKEYRRLQADAPDPKSLHSAILARVAADGYEYLRDYIHLSLLTPFVRASNAYYLPSSYVGQPVAMSREEISTQHAELYQKRPASVKFGNHLQQLGDAGILSFDSVAGKFSGEAEIFERFAKKAEVFA